ncbi:MAG: sulfite exporter TauE/SafE family protein [Gemmatimonadaceae bacterium]|nr:sulfite exporter TauE/SafE family protein [Gemmatimonadaceae bacterium]
MSLPDIAPLLATRPYLALPLTFAAGVLSSLTPCVYPMIPITAAVVAGTRGAAVETPRRHLGALAPTAGYVLGLSLVYASLGLIAGLTGTLFGAVSTHPAALLLQANVLLLFALMSLDVIPVLVPSRLMTWAARRESGGRFWGAAAMGAVSGIVAAPCGAPIFGALLTWVAGTGNAVLGFGYLFSFALGMSSLLMAVGLGTDRLIQLPRAGAWMVWIKRGFAALMIGVAEWYLVGAGKQLF